jgi:sulfate transport system substrate-binding protein
MTRHTRLRNFAAALAVATLGFAAVAKADVTILNVSYDPTRELYKAFDTAFADYWKKQSGETVTIEQSHGGSGAQARAVIDGLAADVVTLALEGDINKIASATKKIPADWRGKLPHNSTPYTSTIVFLVRKGNPKGIKDWGDLIKDGVEVITPNPKTSGGAQWNFLAAWDYANTTFGGDEKKSVEFVTALYKHVPVLDTGARGSTTTFVQREIGDVLLAWENEAFLAVNELGPDKFDIVVPPTSIKAEPPVALVVGNTDAKGTTKVAQAYLEYLYTDVGQKLIARHFYRPALPELADPEDLKRFPEVKLVSIDDPLFGGWKNVTPKFFAEGGIFDQIYKPTQ